MPGRSRELSPTQILVLGFLVLIALGTVLLWLPLSSRPGHTLTLVQAFFTATSAVCVTGLIVVDTPEALALPGQLILLGLIQLGGLGYMTLTTTVAVTLGRRVTLQERLALQESLHADTLEGLVPFTKRVITLTLAFEILGALVLTARWWSEHGPARAVHLGVFHAVSAFNNAGFSLFSTSLMEYRSDPVVNLVIVILFVSGGVGYLVLSDLLRRPRHPGLSLNTRLVLALTAILGVGATLAVYVLERGNPATLGPLGTGDAWLAAAFQALTPRTAGFNTLDIGALREPTLFVLMALMFIGGGPGSTAGGIKLTTFGITVLALWAAVRGRRDAVLFARRLPEESVVRAFAIALIAFLAVNVVAGLLLVMEGRPLTPTLFETISAFGTVGLSMGQPGSPVSLAGHFSVPGQLLLALLMFAGRLGPLTLAIALARWRPTPAFRYPEGKVLIG